MNLDESNAVYKKNKLRKRIQRHMSFGNMVTSIMMLCLLIVIVTTLVGFMGKGFTDYTSRKISEAVAESYETSMSLEELESTVGDIVSGSPLLTAEELAVMRSELIEKGDLANMHEITLADNLLKGMRFFDYRIIIHEEVIYDSFDSVAEEGGLLFEIKNLLLTTKIVGSTASPVRVEGEQVGVVEVSLSSELLGMTVGLIGAMTFMFVLINTLISRIITFLTSKIIAKPLEVLVDQMKSLANEELEDAFDTVLKVKRPVSEVASLMSSTERIMTKMSEYYQTTMAQNEELEAQRDELESQRDELEAQRDELEAQNEALTVTGENLQSMNDAYLSRTLKLQNLMDNIGQGFMTFHRDLRINSEYSSVCGEMLSHEGQCLEIQDVNVAEMLAVGDEEKSFLTSLLQDIFDGSVNERKLLMPLLPDEVNFDGRTLSVEYKMVRDEGLKDQMMVILTDITQTRQLEAQIAGEKERLEMIVHVLLDMEGFSELMADFEGYLKSGDLIEIDTDRMMRRIHTFKGSFSQYYMNETVQALNVIENKMQQDSLNTLESGNIDVLINALEKDVNVIEGYLGEEFWKCETSYNITEEYLQKMENQLQGILPANIYCQVDAIFKRIRYRSVKSIMKNMPIYTLQLCDRIGKSLEPFEITGEDIYVDSVRYKEVFDSLIHVFRNAVDHGIETMDDRLSSGKSMSAKLACHVCTRLDGSLEIRIADDGRGLDLDVIGKKAISSGVVDEKTFLSMSQEDKTSLIFAHGLTTKEEATNISGRGAGLAAVMESVDAVGGCLEVKSAAGKGTEIVVVLPLEQDENYSIGTEACFGHIIKSTEQFMEHVGMKDANVDVCQTNKMRFDQLNGMITLEGAVNGVMLLSGNHQWHQQLVDHIINHPYPDADKEEVFIGVLTETLNLILGNALGSMEEDGVYLEIGVPMTLSCHEAVIQCGYENIFKGTLSFGEGQCMQVCLLTDDVT